MGISRYRTLISAPLPRVWDFVARAENLHVWGPAIEPVKGFGRPMQVGDRVTFWRRDFLRRTIQDLLVEEVIPERLLRFRDLSKGGQKTNVQATLSVEESSDRESTWLQEEISYTLGKSRVVQGLDRWLLNPLMQMAVSSKTAKVFRRLDTLLKVAETKSELPQ
jgi:ligand-binding SRPBCC domain-containing protein